MTEDHHPGSDPAARIPDGDADRNRARSAGGNPRQQLHVAARTDPGLIRSNNEDSFFAGDRVLVVADGMGGHAAGEVASRLVVEAIAPLDERAPSPDLSEDLIAATRRGNAAIAGLVAEHPDLDGMGTTVTAVLFDGHRAALVHVGDSRAYLYRDGVLHQLTHDDTFVQSLVDEGRITEEQAHEHPQRNLVLRALTGIDVDPSVAIRETHAGDRYLLCSDGLCGVVEAELIGDALADPNPNVAADTLIQLSLAAGAPDNVTVVVADVLDIGDGAADFDQPVHIAALDDPAATNPIQQLTREMPRVPLPPIPEEPGEVAEILTGSEDYAEDDIEDDTEDEPDEDVDEDFVEDAAEDTADDDSWDDYFDPDDSASHASTDASTDAAAGHSAATIGSEVPDDAPPSAGVGEKAADDAVLGAAGAAHDSGDAAPTSTGRPTEANTRSEAGTKTSAAGTKTDTAAQRAAGSRPGRGAPKPVAARAKSSKQTHPSVRRRWYRRGALALAVIVLLGVAITGSTMWVRGQYFVSDQGNLVVVFRGVDGTLLGWHLSTFEETSCADNTECTPMRVSDLQPAAQNQVRAGIKAVNLADARDVVQRLSGQLLPPCPRGQTSSPTADDAVPGTTTSPEITTETPSAAPPVPPTDTTTSGSTADSTATRTPRTTPGTAAAAHAAAPTTSASLAPPRTEAAAATAAQRADGGAGGLVGKELAATGNPENTVIPGKTGSRVAAAAGATAPSGSGAASHTTVPTNHTASPTSHTGAPTSDTTTSAPGLSTVTMTETVTATPLAPAPAVPGVTCRSVP